MYDLHILLSINQTCLLVCLFKLVLSVFYTIIIQRRKLCLGYFMKQALTIGLHWDTCTDFIKIGMMLDTHARYFSLNDLDCHSGYKATRKLEIRN